MSRGTIGITLALLVTEYHRKLGTSVKDGDLGFRCPVCSQPVRASEAATQGARGHFEHIDERSTCRRTQGARLPYALQSDVLARHLTADVRRVLTEPIGEAYRDFPDPDGPIYAGRTPGPVPAVDNRHPRRHAQPRTS